jgi:N-acyl-L-homoserine lactone synthetase
MPQLTPSRTLHVVARGTKTPAARSYTTVRADDTPALLEQTYRLRYQTYCLERTFLSASDYPRGTETDEFDRFSTHFATRDADDRVVGTIRLVWPSVQGLPLFRRCTLFPGETAIYALDSRVVELSRLAVAPAQRPRGFGSDTALFSLYQAVYHETKRAGVTHWLMAAEPSLQRILARYGFLFRPVGPTVDYWGPVTPYMLDLADLDRLLLLGGKPQLAGFMDGLEEIARPKLHEL